MPPQPEPESTGLTLEDAQLIGGAIGVVADRIAAREKITFTIARNVVIRALRTLPEEPV